MTDSRKIVDRAKVPTRVQRVKPAKPMAAISILDAVRDADIWRPWFRDPETWRAWFVVLKVLFGLALDPDELAIFQRHTGRTTPHPDGYYDVCLICGRRAGKSLLFALVAAFFAAFYDWKPFLTGGERAVIMVIAADRRQASVIFKYLREMLSVPLLRGLIQRETSEVLELSNGVTVEIATASFKSLRGRSVCLGLCDELAFWMTDTGANPDTEIVGALRPSMATIPNARLLKASSPYSRRGILWSDFEKHYGVEDSRTLVWKSDSKSMNPTIDDAVISAAYEADAAHAEAEFGGNFRSDVSTLFDRDAIRRVTISGRLELPPARGVRYFAHCDPSGGSSDAMTLAIGHCEGETAILDAVRERRPPFSPEDVVAEFSALLRTYNNLSDTRGDRYAGHWVIEAFEKRGIRYEHSERTASELYLEFLPLLNAGRVELLDHRRGLAQLIALERRTSRTGRDTVSHPPSGHDDIANVISAVLVRAALEQEYTYDDDQAPLTADEDYRLATQAFVLGQLTGRELYWYRLETARRNRALPARDTGGGEELRR